MKKSILYLVLTASVVVNIVLICVFMPKSCSNKERRQATAEVMAKKLVCENLFYPDSYDPVNTTVDSLFYNYLTDIDCLNAAINLIDLRYEYEAAESSYKSNDCMIKSYDNSGGPFLEQEINARAEASARMKELQPKIEKQQHIIRNRNTEKDGEFIGWQVTHRYRSSNSKGEVSFGNVILFLDPTLTQCYYRFSIDYNGGINFKSIKETIENELGISLSY